MPQVYDRVLSCFAKGLGYPEDFFVAVRPLSFHLHVTRSSAAGPLCALLDSTALVIHVHGHASTCLHATHSSAASPIYTLPTCTAATVSEMLCNDRAAH